MDTSKELLDINSPELYEQLLLQAGEAGESSLLKPAEPSFNPVAPKPGFCLKTKNDEGEKVFINICTGENLPVPQDLSDEDLMKLLDSDDPSGFRIPMSLGEPHAELDKGGGGCTAYDVVVNPAFYSQVQARPVLQGFFLTVVLEGLEQKYSITLSREWNILKNRKFLGSLPEQNIRTKSKPLIMELERLAGIEHKEPNKPLISEVSSSQMGKDSSRPRAPEPPYEIIQEPPFGHPEYLVAEIHLPKVKSADSLTLDIGEDRILLETRANIYYLNIYLPYDLYQEECGAQFNRITKILTITMPVQPQS